VALDRPIRYLIALTAVLTLAPAVAFAERELADGTVADQWTLANGLKVVTRHVPGADAVAIVVAYPNGRDSDPAGQEGLSALMAEAAFSAAAGEIPARTHAELESQRPVGWNVQTERHRTEFAEMATPEQFPGVLHQVATRMRSVKLTDDVVSRAREALRERQRALIDGDIGAELYLELGQRGVDILTADPELSGKSTDDRTVAVVELVPGDLSRLAVGGVQPQEDRRIGPLRACRPSGHDLHSPRQRDRPQQGIPAHSDSPARTENSW
jgi:hypothetical protein